MNEGVSFGFSTAGAGFPCPRFIFKSVIPFFITISYNQFIVKKVVLLRHGQSTYNAENKFCGWTDVPLTNRGVEEAKNSARLLQEACFTFDIAYTNVLSRAVKTTWIVLEHMDLMWIPVYKTWRLNERHYGALQGLDKTAVAKEHGEDQMFEWRRSFSVAPPALDKSDPRNTRDDPRYHDLTKDELPLTESLKDTQTRTLPYWHETITPEIKKGTKVLISASGNSLRALIKYLDNISDQDINQLNIPTGIPLIYELNDNLTPIKHYYLGDQEKIEAATQEVAGQGKI